MRRIDQTKPRWRFARASDLPAIDAIAARLHPGLAERPDVFAEKMRLYPDGCRVLAAGADIVGYGLSHPWKLNQVPPLDRFLERLPGDADCLYLHDIAVLPDCRGGAARDYVAFIETLARASDIAALALVSVYGTRILWERLGFRPVQADTALRGKLATYGDGATYMRRDLPPE